MMTLNDGRSELWQWDTGRKLTVDADCTQVHFSNKVFGRSIDVNVVDGIAVIPDVLLQSDKELNVWAFVGSPESGYTKISKTLKVNKRNKPSDYVFTPTDQTTLEKILDRINELENTAGSSIDQDQIKNAVDEYLQANPPAVTETDPTVPDWAKQPEKPVYTADEVGALRQGELQTGINLALEQAKTSGAFNGKDGEDGKAGADGKSAYQYAQDAGYGGTEEEFARDLAEDVIPAPDTATVGQTIVVKEVDENGKPVSWECADMASGGDEWELINDITLTEPVPTIYVSTDKKGESFKLKKIELYVDGNSFTVDTGATGTTIISRVCFNTQTWSWAKTVYYDESAKNHFIANSTIDENTMITRRIADAVAVCGIKEVGYSTINSVLLSTANTNNIYFGTNTRVVIRGVRA
jgi:hypothetical protein